MNKLSQTLIQTLALIVIVTPIMAATPIPGLQMSTQEGTFIIPSTNYSPREQGNLTASNTIPSQENQFTTNSFAQFSLGTPLSPSSNTASKACGEFHTNYILFRPADASNTTSQPIVGGASPQQLYQRFNIPENGGVASAQAHGIIGIIAIGSDPTLMSDLNTYSAYYGLPLVTNKNFLMLNAPNQSGAAMTQGEQQDVNAEADLDVEMVHAMAPQAKIVVFCARSLNGGGGNNVPNALTYAGSYVNENGGGEVSCSMGAEYGYGDPIGATGYSVKNYPNVAYVASTGDDGSFTSIPAALPNVIAAGGMSIPVQANSPVSPWCDIFVGVTQPSGSADLYNVYNTVLTHSSQDAQSVETYYNNIINRIYQNDGLSTSVIGIQCGNGGFSLQQAPSYQTNVLATTPNLVGPLDPSEYGVSGAGLIQMRATPDISFSSDPECGVSIYSNGEWSISGGTSVSAPAISGMINASGVAFCKNSNDSFTNKILTNIYSNFQNTTSDFILDDVTNIPTTTQTIPAFGPASLKITPPSVSSYAISIDLYNQLKMGQEYTGQAVSPPLYSYTYLNYSRKANSGYNIATGTGAPYGYGCFQSPSA
ncbi:MAG: hypothetical protein NTX05_04525 [Fusobacteria bacterium]|nr:hypothetical protein [Fusobacteriota bacterium]